ncbi:uncharacterized protein LOC117114470 [Anneissia japonica]|uniref:uncharacterized protein LOC117114470 n=1 Tax=Anneissia japonica TaxID=1529436 RepID=UPI0014256E3F|nr:uncharacterized protein LOC117114470 [Anneissia japonica]
MMAIGTQIHHAEELEVPSDDYMMPDFFIASGTPTVISFFLTKWLVRYTAEQVIEDFLDDESDDENDDFKPHYDENEDVSDEGEIGLGPGNDELPGELPGSGGRESSGESDEEDG